MKPNKLASVQKKKQINATKQKRDAKRFNNRKEHDTQGKDVQARRSWP
jgi:hypothetical protein